MATLTLPAAVTDRIGDPRVRRWTYAALALVLAILCVFPQPFIGRAKIVPQDPTSPLGSSLGGAASQLQNLSAIFGGGRRAIDLYLTIGQSEDVRNDVIKKLGLVGSSSDYPDIDRARVRLAKHVDVELLPGGVLQIEARSHDDDEALRLTQAFTEAISKRLRELNGQQVVTKRELLEGRLREAASRLARAQTVLDAFRRANRISAVPEAELSGAIAVKTGLEANLQAKLVEEQTLEQMLGPDNPQLRAVRSQVAELRGRLAQTTAPTLGQGGPNAGGLTEISSQYINLYRDYIFAQSVYEVYTRLSEEVAVEEVSGREAPTVQVIEAPHIDPERHFNVPAVAALALLALLAFVTEVYAPATGIALWPRRAASNA